MRVTIEFQQLEHTPSLDEKIKQKSQKFEKYFRNEVGLKWRCYVKSGVHHAECTIHGHRETIHAKAHSDNLYKTLDKVCEKLEKQINKSKQKVKNKIHRKQGNVIFFEPEIAWGEFEAEKEAA
ncbi:MAG: ribosome hibernation-promoting factor, HPF/YfiA family [Bacteriovoracaceae bacterium]